MKRVALISGLVLPWLGAAQTAAQLPHPPETVTRIVRVQYGNPQTLAGLAGHGMGRVIVDADNTLRAVVIKGSPEMVTEVERTIHELDVPASLSSSRDVQITVSVLGASSKPTASLQAELPENLASVVKQLSAIFPYKSYQLLSSMLMRSREGGSSESQGVMQGVSSGPEGSYPSPYKLSFLEPTIATSNGKSVVHLRGFRLTTSARIAAGPQSWKSAEIGITTDIDLPEGEKVVVGKTNTESGDAALFVILSARVVD